MSAIEVSENVADAKARIANICVRHLGGASRATVRVCYRRAVMAGGASDFRVISRTRIIPTEVEFEVHLTEIDVNAANDLHQCLADLEAEISGGLPLNCHARLYLDRPEGALSALTRFGVSRLGHTMVFVGGMMASHCEPLATVDLLLKLVKEHRDNERDLRLALEGLFKDQFEDGDILTPSAMNSMLIEMRSLAQIVQKHDASIVKLLGMADKPHKQRPGS